VGAPQVPSDDVQHGPTPKPASTRARQTVGRILDATGQRARARAARTTFARALTTLGLKNGISTGDYMEDWRRFMKVAGPPPVLGVPGGRRKRIAFVVPEGLYPPAKRGHGIMSAALRVRGADVMFVTCDRCLPACESTSVLDYGTPAEFLQSDRPKPCDECYAGVEAAVDAFGLPRTQLSAYSSPDLRKEAEETAEQFRDAPLTELVGYLRDGLALGQVVETSLFRFFLVGTLPETEDVRATARRYLRASVEVAGMMEQFIDVWRPDVIVSQCGLYLITGTSMAVAESRGVDQVVWDVGYRRSSVLASHKGGFVSELRLDKDATWDTPLDPEQSRALSIYLDGRRRGARDDATYHPSPVESRDAVLAATGLQDGERLVSVFTNVVWDARVYAPDRLFRGPVEWMIETIRHVLDTPGVRYVVRVHPAEVKLPKVITQERMDEHVRAIFPKLPDNVVIISPEDHLSSYSLAAASDLAVVYSTQMGLETLAMGVPTVVAGDPFYSRKGLGIEPQDLSAYYQLLTHPTDIPPMTPDEVELARRYAYYYFFRRMIILPDIIDAARTGLPRIRDLRDLEPGRYTGLDALCNGIMSGTPFEAEDPMVLESILDGKVS